MNTRQWQWMTAGWLLAAVLLGGSPASAQSTGFSTTGPGGTSTATVNNAPVFDPAAAAAAALLGTYRVPGSATIDPTGAYRVPTPDTSGGSAAATTTTAGSGGTTNTTTATGAASAGSASP
jgi:hypothetical protein